MSLRSLKRRFGLFAGVLVFSLILLLSSNNPAYAITFTRNVFLQNALPNSIEFRWVTDTNAQLTVKYGTTTSYGSQVTSDTVSGTGGNNNHAKITGLSANTKYYYQILAGSTAITPAGDSNYFFRTAPNKGATSPFTWAIWGDGGTGGSAQTAVASQLESKSPNLVIVAGDIAYPYSTDFNNNNSKYFNPYKNTMRKAPFYVTCGNHETSCPTVMADHSLPGGGSVGGVISTYSWDYGNVHFVALNSNLSHNYNASSPQSSDSQIAWAYNDLKASGQPWKVVFWHHNGWSAGSHSTNSSIVDNMIHMSADAGADIVLWGHSHVFERWNRKSGFYPEVQAYTIGNGGKTGSSSCSSSSPGPGCAAKSTSSSEAGFLFFEVNGNQMTQRYIKMDGSNPDTITLTSSGSSATSTPSPNSCNTCYNYNGSGQVDVQDVLFVANRWGLSLGDTNYSSIYDIYCSSSNPPDGNINILDLQTVANNWGSSSCVPS